MESLIIRCGVNKLNLRRLNHVNRTYQISRAPVLYFPKKSKKFRRITISATIGAEKTSSSSSLMNSLLSLEQSANEGISSEKIDEWMLFSVREIVDNLHSAPLLVQIYTNETGKMTKRNIEAATEDDWPAIKAKWERNEAKSPQGVMLVEELNEPGDDGEKIAGREGGGNDKKWGIMVQWRGCCTGPVCYLLETSTVWGTRDVSFTYFYHTKVKNFWESAASQLAKCWLVR